MCSQSVATHAPANKESLAGRLELRGHAPAESAIRDRGSPQEQADYPGALCAYPDTDLGLR
jgi:hypothetical protein